MAGLGVFLHDHGRRTGDQDSLRRAMRAAERMFLYAVPHGTGAYVVGEHGLRLSGDLWHGAAGVLLFCAQVLDDRTDTLFTLDDRVPQSSRQPR
jgi:hypothetical protein